MARFRYRAPTVQASVENPFAAPYATADDDGDASSWWQDAQENLTEQINDAGESIAEAFRIMQVHSLRANREILNGLLEVTKSQLEKAERSTPAVEKVPVD